MVMDQSEPLRRLENLQTTTRSFLLLLRALVQRSGGEICISEMELYLLQQPDASPLFLQTTEEGVVLSIKNIGGPRG